MVLSGRRLLLGLSIVIAAMAIVIFVQPEARWLAIICAFCALLIAILLNVLGQPGRSVVAREPDDVAQLSPARRAELIRGTSLYLRELHYRYSVRIDATESPERRCFNAEVNTVRLGFVPALVTDNTNDRQGYGYVAFVYDNKRWRGPGLPCPAGQAQAVKHAARCVSPLATDEETSF